MRGPYPDQVRRSAAVSATLSARLPELPLRCYPVVNESLRSALVVVKPTSFENDTIRGQRQVKKVAMRFSPFATRPWVAFPTRLEPSRPMADAQMWAPIASFDACLSKRWQL